MGRPRHPAAGRSGAGDRTRTLHRRSCRRALHCASCAARSPPAASSRITAPDGAKIVTAADLAGARPIRPMLHKFNYRPIEQPLLAKDVVRFVGEPVAAVVCAERAPKPRTSPIASRSRSTNCRRWSTRATRSRRMRRASMTTAAMSWSKAGSRPRISTRRWPRRTAASASSVRSRRQNATPLEARAAHAAFDPAIGPHHADLRHADAASDAHRHRRRARFCRIRPARDRARRRRRLRAENVAAGRICRAGLAGAAVAQQRRLERGPARESDRRLPQPRPACRTRRRASTSAASSSRSPPTSSPISAPIRAFRRPAASSR